MERRGESELEAMDIERWVHLIFPPTCDAPLRSYHSEIPRAAKNLVGESRCSVFTLRFFGDPGRIGSE
jgi:hypothetical protein